MIYQLHKSQQLYCDIETAWCFFSNPENLPEITPDTMGFKIVSKPETHKIYEGMTIDYKVSPLLGIQMHWQTIITQVSEGRSFTDFQEKGPYTLWNHFHEFIPNEKGVLIKDTIDYKLPMGILGQWLHRMMIKRKLEAIFDYRYRVLEERFNSNGRKKQVL
ncbi:hypothetical protein ED312_07615 [Sinomicrobium pectinilyticum]|uniref:Cell division inhibitor n=1 Tax=Sinomicrobium pectinilyticum TaxID=1084421 RepID=A0A3N0EMN2_SINP1|nr:SRPBCC family protein [Sinomicrobium pectinilyticum]RNL89158.1 hypothetical protein ED312_07615 [Sinomicrobium pectinilyticum]